MKKILTSIASVGIMVVPFAVLGARMVDANTPLCCGVGTLIDNITNWLFALLIAIAVISLIIAAIYFVTAQGDAAKVATARQFVIYAIVGVVVGFIAKALVMFAGTIVGGSAPQ
jgi:hypothetical protein